MDTFGLTRHAQQQCAINHRPSDGLKNAYRLAALGFVTVALLDSHAQQYSKVCRVEYWSTYSVTPTAGGLAALEAKGL